MVGNCQHWELSRGSEELVQSSRRWDKAPKDPSSIANASCTCNKSVVKENQWRFGSWARHPVTKGYPNGFFCNAAAQRGDRRWWPSVRQREILPPCSGSHKFHSRVLCVIAEDERKDRCSVSGMVVVRPLKDGDRAPPSCTRLRVQLTEDASTRQSPCEEGFFCATWRIGMEHMTDGPQDCQKELCVSEQCVVLCGGISPRKSEDKGRA